MHEDFIQEFGEELPSRRRRPSFLRRLLSLTLTGCLIALLLLRGHEAYYLVRFGVRTIHSISDLDHDFIDDYTDMVLGARAYIRTKPLYDSGYYGGGYPPDGSGVCADVIWQAFKAAGYDFKAMIDQDIAQNPKAYPLPNSRPDPNIDFRRVVNLKVFFERHGQSLTTDITQIDQWQPGDLVFYEGHVAIVSTRRNSSGIPYIIHHTGHGAFEEDAITYKPITGHYRWIAG